MGSRNLTIVILDSEVKIAQYGHWGAYPEENGASLARWIKNDMDLRVFKKAVKDCSFITQEEADQKVEDAFNKQSIVKKLKNAFNRINNPFSHPKVELTANCSAYICKLVQEKGGLELVNNIDFISSSIWNEWSYVLDLDNKRFEIYCGFNKTKLKKNDRFYSYTNKGEIEIDTDDGKRFYPLKMIKSFGFKELSIKKYDKFVEDYYKSEEDEDGN
jgi:hypothetical protein